MAPFGITVELDGNCSFVTASSVSSIVSIPDVWNEHPALETLAKF